MGEAKEPAGDTAPGVIRDRSPFLILTVAVVGMVVAVRLCWLDSLQREAYGDITIICEYLERILAGQWPTYFDLSSGPLYHYLITPIVALAGINYDAIKFAAVLTSLGVLVATYALGRRLVDDWFALTALLIAGTSSWLLVFSRLGNSQIAVPLLTTTALWLVARVAQLGRRVDVFACAVVSALGLYVYPQSFILPGVCLVTLVCLRWTGHHIEWADLGRFVAVVVACAIPFVAIWIRHAHLFSGSGYIGSKLMTANVVGSLVDNTVAAALAFHVRGDHVVRSNPAHVPHLDPISGVLILLGVLFWLHPRRRALAPLLLAPFVLLQVPSVLVLSSPVEVPSASRTLGAAPLAYLLVASGLWAVVEWARAGVRRANVEGAGVWPKRAVLVSVAVVLMAVIPLNLHRYFRVYLSGLPYHNTPVASLVAEWADSLPAATHVVLMGCCWQSGMPEPKALRFSMNRPQRLLVVDPAWETCDTLALLPRPAVLVWSFHDALPGPLLEPCAGSFHHRLHTSPEGREVFRSSPLLADPPPTLAHVLREHPGGSRDLHYTRARAGDDAIGVLHTPFDLGSAGDLFDGRWNTLVRVDQHLDLEMHLVHPRAVAAVELDLGSLVHAVVRASLEHEGGEVVEVSERHKDLPGDPHLVLTNSGYPYPVRVVRIAIDAGDWIHLREVVLAPSAYAEGGR